MADEPRVSAVLAVHNGERFLAEALASLREQTRPLDELVVVDDASFDSTSELLAAERRDAPYKVVVIRNGERLGPGVASERGLWAASGDVLLICDHDDVSEPTRVAVSVERLGGGRPPAALFSDATVIDAAGNDRGRLWELAGVPNGGGVLEGAALQRELLRRNLAWGTTMALDARLLPLVRPLPAFAADYWIALVADALATLIAEPRRLVRYRVHGENISGGAPVRNPLTALRSYRQHADYFDTQRRLFEDLTEHLRDHRAGDAVVAAVAAKAAHLQVRTSRSSHVGRRVWQIGAEVARGGYRRYSPGPRSAVFDLVFAPPKQPPRDTQQASL